MDNFVFSIHGFTIDQLFDKLPLQRGFSKNSAGDLVPALMFLNRPYDFCNFVIMFSLM